MKCKIDGCGNSAYYKSQQVCQKHYFRYMRNGSYDLAKRDFKPSVSPNGYRTIYAKGHPISVMAGRNRVFEHRVVFFDNVNSSPDRCDMCGTYVNWQTLHIDHIDNDRLNNDPKNLRCLCRGCNTKLGYTSNSYGTEITFGGRRMTAEAWSMEPDVNITGSTIRRRLRNGQSIENALFGEKITHKNAIKHSKANNKKIKRKHNEKTRRTRLTQKAR